MKIEPRTALIVAGVAIGAYVVYRASHAIGAAAHAINPLNNNNVFARAVNDVVSPSGTSSLGSKLYDWLHGGGTVSTRTVCTRDLSGKVVCRNV